MKKILILMLVLMITLVSCTKEEVAETTEPVQTTEQEETVEVPTVETGEAEVVQTSEPEYVPFDETGEPSVPDDYAMNTNRAHYQQMGIKVPAIGEDTLVGNHVITFTSVDYNETENTFTVNYNWLNGDEETKSFYDTFLVSGLYKIHEMTPSNLSDEEIQKNYEEEGSFTLSLPEGTTKESLEDGFLEVVFNLYADLESPEFNGNNIIVLIYKPQF